MKQPKNTLWDWSVYIRANGYLIQCLLILQKQDFDAQPNLTVLLI